MIKNEFFHQGYLERSQMVIINLSKFSPSDIPKIYPIFKAPNINYIQKWLAKKGEVNPKTGKVITTIEEKNKCKKKFEKNCAKKYLNMNHVIIDLVWPAFAELLYERYLTEVKKLPYNESYCIGDDTYIINDIKPLWMRYIEENKPVSCIILGDKCICNKCLAICDCEEKYYECYACGRSSFNGPCEEPNKCNKWNIVIRCKEHGLLIDHYQ